MELKEEIKKLAFYILPADQDIIYTRISHIEEYVNKKLSEIKVSQVDAEVIMKTGVNFKYAIGNTIWIKEMECEAKILSLWYSKTGIRYQCRWAAEGKYNEEYLFENEILDKKP